MAITFTKQPSGIYPAFNDAYINFTSTLTGTTYAEITATNFEEPFKIFSDTNGDFQFNLKPLVKIQFNGFEDENTIPPSGYIQTVTDRLLSYPIDIVVNNNVDVIQSATTTYEFLKSVQQVGEPYYDDDTKILHHTTNGMDYHLTYFEGYEFFFEFQKLQANDVVKVKNINTGDDVSFSATTSGTNRLWVDKVSANWITSGALPLTDTVNRCEVYINDVFKYNLNLKKPTQRCGVYLKWYNSKGGYSFHLFEEFFRINNKGKSLGELTRNSFLNIDESPKSFSYNLGKEISKEIIVTTKVDKNELYILEDVVASPSVQLYLSNDPYISGEWVTVNINGNIDSRTKNNITEVKLTVELPTQNTITY